MENTSAEPGRKVAYSRDIGWRVVWQKVGMGLTFRQIASRLQIATGTAHRIFARFQDTGDISPKPRHGQRRPACRKLDDLHEIYILGMIADNPGLYLSEIARNISDATNVLVDGSTVCRLLHRHGCTRKKIVQVAKQRCVEYRARFMIEAFNYRKEMFVFVDETGSDKRDHTRKFGYALKGESPVYHRWLVRGQRISAIAAICCDGLVAYDLTTGTVNGEQFLEFVQGSLIPQMAAFDGSSDRSIVVLDNCSIHHVPDVVEEFRKVGVMVLFLPPYSPDYMPIELCFSYIKYYLKSHDDILQAVSDPSVILKSAFDSVTQDQCSNWIKKCSYE